MPKYQIFNNKSVLEPGSYTRILGGDKKAPESISTGKVMIIDTGIGAGYGGGSGSKGTKFNGKKSIYGFDNVDELRAWVGGGILWDVASRIFKPSKDENSKGAEQVMIFQAKESTPSSLFMNFTNGYIELGSYIEGLAGNGRLNTVNTLTRGLGMKMFAGPNNTYGVSMFRGSYKGKDFSGLDINNETELASKPRTLVKTPTFGKIIDLVNWMNKSSEFGEYFYVKNHYIQSSYTSTISPPATVNTGIYDGNVGMPAGTYVYKITALTANGETTPTVASSVTLLDDQAAYVYWNQVPNAIKYRIYKDALGYVETNSTGFYDAYTDQVWTTGTPPASNTATYLTNANGAIMTQDLNNMSQMNLFYGGTENYSVDALDDAIASMQEVDNVYFLSDKFGIVEAIGSANTKLITAMKEDGIYDKFLVIGGGKDSTERSASTNSSAAIAAYFNDPYVYVVHGDVLKKNATTSGFSRLNTFYHAATIVGKLAGNSPQDPITWKGLDIDGIVDDMKIKERNELLKAGVLHLRELTSGEFAVNQEVNTLQLNEDMIFPDGTSPEGSIMRIAAILNKEIKLKTEKRFVGSNYNLSDPADVESYVTGILIEKTANKITDNLIIAYKGIKVSLIGTDYHIQYSFVVNSPINRLFITGFVFSPSSTNF